VIERLAAEFHDATHVPFAWKIGAFGTAATRASDAGEPAGTAGQPIAAAIASSGLTNVVAAVVRYFGGTKLGTGGLSRAYRAAAEKALSCAGSRPIYDTVEVRVRCAYTRVGDVRRLLGARYLTLIDEQFDTDCLFRLAVFRSRLAKLRSALEAARLSYELVGESAGGPKGGQASRAARPSSRTD
jgi:putative IMPACT (imprinted ancient) family translation regulator